MVLSKFFSTFARLRQANALEGIHSEKRFRIVLERERARADRNGHQFSLVAFRVGNPEIDIAQVQHLTHILTNRIRLTDETGWLDNQRIGVFLPYTSAAGVWRLADDVCQAIAAKISPPEYTIYTYPSKWLSDSNGHSDQLNFQDISPEWEETMARGFSVYTKHADGGNIDFAPRQLAANRTPNCRTLAEGLELLFLRPLPAWKRAMDIVGATVALIVFSPIMVAVAIAIKLTSKGPVIFKQQRAGLGGKPFTFYKFRTMFENADTMKENLLHCNEQIGPVFKIKADPRITTVGRFLRKTSIDELPQLWNVLTGDMSLVGPRPPTLDEVPHYETWQYKRLAVTPGITCIWQVSGRSKIGFEDWVRMDIRYTKARSLIHDIKILLRTIPAVISQRGAH